jgi:hypothetical protein
MLRDGVRQWWRGEPWLPGQPCFLLVSFQGVGRGGQEDLGDMEVLGGLVNVNGFPLRQRHPLPLSRLREV